MMIPIMRERMQNEIWRSTRANLARTLGAADRHVRATIIVVDSQRQWRNGKNLWHYQLGVPIRSTAGTTYMLDGRQYLLVPSGSSLTAFALPPRP